MEEQLVNFLTTDFGVELFPKADGRVEIPKDVVLFLGWNKSDIINLFFNDGNVYVSDGTFEKNIQIKVSHGRVRIPIGVLKSAGLYRKSLIATFDLNCTMRLTASNSSSNWAINEFIGSLTKHQAEALVNIFMGKSSRDDNSIPSMEIAKISVNQEKLPRPEMFILEALEEKSFIFRPTGNPYKFNFCWVDKTPMLCKNEDNSLVSYVIPGIRRGEDKVGFLLIDETTFGKVCYILKRKNETTAIDKDLIFMFSPKTKIGSFKVYENPKQEINQELVEQSKLVCSNPERFLTSNFNIYSGGNKDFPPTTITTNTIGRIEKNEPREADKN